jgi:hypothetical protein
MWLVLCDRNDVPALWAARGLAARGLEPLELVTTDALAYALRWEHRVGAAGASIAVELADGRRIDGDGLRGVLNRVVALPEAHLHRAAPADLDYARQELSAFFLSWLAALPCPVVNAPTAQGLSGGWRHRSEWLALAARAGLPIAPFRMNGTTPAAVAWASARTVVVVGGEAVSPEAPAPILAGCARLAGLVETAVLGVDFDAAWRVEGATPQPDLRLGGDRALELLAAALS